MTLLESSKRLNFPKLEKINSKRNDNKTTNNQDGYFFLWILLVSDSPASGGLWERRAREILTLLK